MKQNHIIINLREKTTDDHPWGNAQGKEVFRKLVDEVEKHPAIKIFGISLSDIEASDASFPRESVVSLAKQYRGEKGFYLFGFNNNRDLIDNWKYAANAKDQPLIIWDEKIPEILDGKKELSKSNLDFLTYVLSHHSVTTAEIADAFDISIPNASTKLKKLVSLGFIMRSEEVAESGGIEYIYYAINKSR